MSLAGRTAALLLVAVLAAGCTSAEPDASGQPAGTRPAASDEPPPSTPNQPPTASTSPPTTASASPQATGSTSPPATATSPAPDQPSPTSPPGSAAPPHPVSLPALIQQDYDGRGLRVGEVLGRFSTYTRYAVTYRSGDLTISGIMHVPEGAGPFPVLVLNHGYIEPSIYETGQGLAREQDYLARRGYVVLHTDYRNHAASDDDPTAERKLRLGYTEDVVNAVLAVKRSKLPYLDGDRVGLLGRSMGGGVTYNALVVRPDLVDAAVVFAPVSSDAGDNFNRWVREDPGDGRLSDQILTRYGAPERARAFWRAASPRTYFDRVSDPILIHHGTVDESCPYRWSEQTLGALQAAGRQARLVTYPGEGHTFYADWPLSMRRTVRFFERHLEA